MRDLSGARDEPVARNPRREMIPRGRRAIRLGIGFTVAGQRQNLTEIFSRTSPDRILHVGSGIPGLGPACAGGRRAGLG